MTLGGNKTPHHARRLIDERIFQALELLGFEKRKDMYGKRLVKKIAPYFEVYLFIGVQRKGRRFLVEPVIGLDFLPLRSALEELDPPPTTQVCHSYLGHLDREEFWSEMELRGNSIEDDALDRILNLIRNVALPELELLSSVEKIRGLFEDTVHLRKESNFVVGQEHIKLQVLEALLTKNSFGRVN